MDDSNFIGDYAMVCRTCLQSNVEMLSLSALISDSIKDVNSQITYMECLKTCILVEETTDGEMPQSVCLECASALQVSYWFVRNAINAQDLLKSKLRELKQKKIKLEMEACAQAAVVENKKPKRYRCKICNVKVETKRSLKDHVKLHLDLIVYNCQLCSYESQSRNGLADHYIHIHEMEATKEQLKPKTKLSSTSVSPSSATTNDRMEGAIKNEHFQILADNTQQVSNEKYSEPTIMVSSPNTGNLQVSTIITTGNENLAVMSNPFHALDGDLNSNISVANEFVVMADGSLEKVINNDVVIEYIEAPSNDINFAMENDLVLDNIIQMLEPQNDIGQMDVDDLIIEETSDVLEETQVPVILPLEEEIIPASIIEQPKKIMCKICTKDFLTQEQLKNHMLTHNEIPHFFCDQCKFYTFFKIDLHQHYKSKHNLQPTNKQLQPKNKLKVIDEVYACDLCFYETEVKLNLKTHYKMKHNIAADDIHLKATKVEKSKSNLHSLSFNTKAAALTGKQTTNIIKIQSTEPPVPDYPNGLNCRKCHKIFFFRNKLYEHYKMHNAEEAALKQKKQYNKVQYKPTYTNLNQDHNKSKHSPPVQLPKTTEAHLTTTIVSTYSDIDSLAVNVTAPNMTTSNSVDTLTPSSSSTYILPSDAIPQIVETDQTVENDMGFGFHCDNETLFGDFDEVDVENDSDDNDTEFRDVLLTSDDDLEDIMEIKNEINNAKTAPTGTCCAHCQKSFLSQYQFENHMFVHRGLAPYRCELCTNLYNTKRCLIRHYKAVHKNVPTRDMIQAKGDKVCDDNTPLEDLKLESTTCFMCAKCPYECSDLNTIKNHLKSSHNIDDDTFIVRKLPFECPRCIRSFESKMRLLRHLERNHSASPINQHQVRFNREENVSTIATSNISVTSVTTTTNNLVNTIKTESSETNASCAYNEIVTKQEFQHQNTCLASPRKNRLYEDAVAPEVIMSPFKETARKSTYAKSNTSCITNLHTTATALDKNDFEQPLFKCKICFLTCYNLETFNEHSKNIHCREIGAKNPDSIMLFECEICHCYYKTMYLLRHHLKRHIGRKFLCTDCPKTFINKMELQIHKYVHNGERPHKCDVCPKSFRYVHHLKRHKDSAHFGKRYACTEPNCGRKFTTLAQLKVHVWNHNGIVPYKCQFCNRLFKKRLLLREHCLKIHNVNLSEEQMADIFRNRLGYTNPHDFTVTIGNGKMLRRGDLEIMGASGVIKSSFK